MKKRNGIILILGIVVTLAILIKIVIFILSKVEESICYNLPLNEFYNTPTCLKYVENLDE